MTNLSPDICFKLRDARRAAKLSQSDLAAEVGCKQSALSMFEQGRPTKLNDEVVEKLAKKFNISLTPPPSTSTFPSNSTSNFTSNFTSNSNSTFPSNLPLRGFCPNPNCLSNKPYVVDGRELRLPDREMADPVGAKFCAICGEVLEKHCPNCGSPVHAGSICSLCGEPYVAV